MPDPTPESVACPTCKAAVGMWCRNKMPNGDVLETYYGGESHWAHVTRIEALSQSRPPNPEWERFAEEIDDYADRQIENDTEFEHETMWLAVKDIAAIARRIARGGR